METRRLTEADELAEALILLLNEESEVELSTEDGAEGVVDDVRSFGEGGVLTMDAGFTLYLSNGAQFQVTVVKSQMEEEAEEEEEEEEEEG